MLVVRYFRTDLVTGEPTAECDYAIIPSSADCPASQHEMAVRFAKYRPTAVAYRIEEGDLLCRLHPISLTHMLK